MCTPAIFTALSMYSTYNNIKAQNKRLQAESTLLATNAAEQSKMDLKAIKMRTTQEGRSYYLRADPQIPPRYA